MGDLPGRRERHSGFLTFATKNPTPSCQATKFIRGFPTINSTSSSGPGQEIKPPSYYSPSDPLQREVIFREDHLKGQAIHFPLQDVQCCP